MQTGVARFLESNSSKQLRALFASGRPLLYIVSAEERRVGRLLREMARHFFPEPVPLWSWSLTDGMQGSDDAALGSATIEPRAALDFIAGFEGPAIFHLKDFHEPLREAAGIRRRLRDVYELCLDRGNFVVISSPIRVIPDELSGRHGLPEWAFAQACRLLEGLAPAVVWFDEIELGITSAASLA